MLNRNGIRRSVGALAVTLCAVVGLTGCSLVPASWKVAFGSANEVTAYFDNVAGLYTSNDVSVLGMPVGEVTAIEPQGNRVKVTMTVDRKIDLPADVTAAIINTSIVTTRHIELSPVYSGGPKLQNHAVIQKAKAPVSVGDLFDGLDKLVNSLKGSRPGEGPIADMVDITSGVTSGNGQRLRDSIDQLSQVSQLGAENGDALAEIITTIQKLTSTLVANYPKMTAFSRSVNQVASTLSGQAPGLNATLANLNTALTNTTTFLQGNSGTISSASRRLAVLAANLSDYSRQVIEAIDVGPLLFQNLSNSISAEQGAWRAQLLLDKTLLDGEALSRFCEAIDLQKDGCRTGQLKDFGPDLGIYSGLLELSK